MPSTKISMHKENPIKYYVIYNCLHILLFPFFLWYLQRDNYEHLQIWMSVKKTDSSFSKELDICNSHLHKKELSVLTA